VDCHRVFVGSVDVVVEVERPSRCGPAASTVVVGDGARDRERMTRFMEAPVFVRLVVRLSGTLVARGLYSSYSAAERGDGEPEMLDPATWMSRPIAVTPVSSLPLTTDARYPAGGVLEIPDDLVELLATVTHHPVGDDGPVVVVVAGMEAPHPGVVIGPFSTSASAAEWVESAGSSAGSHPMTCHHLLLEQVVG
jgi:hypothetical protein